MIEEGDNGTPFAKKEETMKNFRKNLKEMEE